MFIDSHFHTDVYERYEGALEQALAIIAEQKILVVSNSCDIPSYESTLKIAEQSRFVLPVFGIHPQEAIEYIKKLDSIQEIVDNSLAFGEIGLDHLHVEDTAQYPVQTRILELFFDAAKKQDKIVFLHLDGAEDEALEMLRSFSLPKVVVHGYIGSLKTLKNMIELDVYFSIGGNAIMDKWKAVIPVDERQSILSNAREVPSDLLLVETDGPCRTSPEQSPDGPRSMPIYIKDIMNKVAEIRKTSVDELREQVIANFLRLINNDRRLDKYSSLIKETK